MKHFRFFTCFIFLFSIFIVIISTQANQKKVWRIGYYEGGPYHEYNDSMRTLIQSLMKRGLIEKKEIPEYHFSAFKSYNHPIYCEWLKENMVSDTFSISLDNCYTSNWNRKERERNRKELIKKLANNEIDIVIAMGTWAGQDLANNEHNVPTIIMSVSDPVKSNIINSIEDSGYDHVTARCDPKRYPRQIRMFHRIVNFKNVGIVHINTEEGKVYSALDHFDQISEERGFKVTTCPITQEAEYNHKDNECRNCFEDLLKFVDAIYFTVLSCEERILPELIKMTIDAKIPSFSLTTSEYVKEGVMMSISSDSGYEAQGDYNAEKIIQILNGASPRSLNQLFEDPLFISVNLNTAERIGFEIPEGILRIASEVYGGKK